MSIVLYILLSSILMILVYLLRFRLASEPEPISIRIATISTRYIHHSHVPPNQFCTALYHSNVNGKKRKPKIGQSRVSNTPVNQLESNQRSAIVKRGAMRPMNATRIGIRELYHAFVMCGLKAAEKSLYCTVI